MSDFISSALRYGPIFNQSKTRKSLPKNAIEMSRNTRVSRSPSKKASPKPKPKKTVKIHSPNNTVLEYDLDEDEELGKRTSPKRGRSCNNKVFPCVYRGTLFETKEEWDEYHLIRHMRNETTNYRSIKSHHVNTLKALSKHVNKRG